MLQKITTMSPLPQWQSSAWLFSVCMLLDCLVLQSTAVVVSSGETMADPNTITLQNHHNDQVQVVTDSQYGKRRCCTSSADATNQSTLSTDPPLGSHFEIYENDKPLPPGYPIFDWFEPSNVYMAAIYALYQCSISNVPYLPHGVSVLDKTTPEHFPMPSINYLSSVELPHWLPRAVVIWETEALMIHLALYEPHIPRLVWQYTVPTPIDTYFGQVDFSIDDTPPPPNFPDISIDRLNRARLINERMTFLAIVKLLKFAAFAGPSTIVLSGRPITFSEGNVRLTIVITRSIAEGGLAWAEIARVALALIQHFKIDSDFRESLARLTKGGRLAGSISAEIKRNLVETSPVPLVEN